MSCVGILKAKGLKLTPQRRVIVEMFHNNGEHLTADEIISNVQDQMPGVSKSTVYRTLDLLESAGCVYKSSLGDRVVYHHADEGHHHHVTCVRCGKTVACGDDLFTAVSDTLRETHGFKVAFNHMVVSGVCQQCIDRGL